MKRNIFIFFVFIIVFFACSEKQKKGFSFEKMLVENIVQPINIDVQRPHFSWIISSFERNHKQTAYQILLASSKEMLENNKADIWDSEKTESAETTQHKLQKAKLKSNQKYYWKAVVWDNRGAKLESQVDSFETAFLQKNDWLAQWIGKENAVDMVLEKGFIIKEKDNKAQIESVEYSGQSLLLRKEVLLPRKIKSAKAFVTGVGFYEFFINGKRVGDHVLDPAKTPYHKEILYSTYDVTDLLHEGKNAFGIHLGNGWYNPYKKWWKQYRMQWFGSKKAFAQIEITYTDGSVETIKTDKSWSCSDGPVVFNCIYDGEIYDANLEQPGWTIADFDESEWKKVRVFHSHNVTLKSQTMPAIKVIQTIQPNEIPNRSVNVRTFDMGQNFTGWVRIKVQGQKGIKIKIRFAEDIREDGRIDDTSNEQANARAEYILKGEGTEFYEPHFTYFGFKYVEVSSVGGFLNLDEITGCVVHTDNRQIGNFECSDSLVNKIHRATVWSQKSNMLGYPMDCPQRDERLGWFGDAQVTAEEAMFNFDMAGFFKNWFRGIQLNQDEETGDLPIISPQPYIWDEGIEWSSTYIIMLWQYYLWYNDKQILTEHYPAMKRYMQFLDSLSNNYILPSGWIGDWGSLVDGWKEGQPESVPTAFYYFNATILSKVAEILENKSDQKYFLNRAEEIKKAYNQNYFQQETGNYNDDSQMANAFPLFLGLAPENSRKKVLDNLVYDIEVNHDNHLTTGVLGTKYMPEALAQMGRADVAWNIITQKTYPGWNSMMEEYTTVCEFWTLKQSKNHVMMGSIDAWFYKYIAGIQPDGKNTAFKTYTIKPHLLEGLKFAKASTETMRGKIAVEWEKQPGFFSLKAEIPFNTSATVYIPGEKDEQVFENETTLENADDVTYIGYQDGRHVLKISSGSYAFLLKKS
ncbi:family 78 glycoside hydrolase catalytic domain [Maribellus maritimus]|uniref:family 78 glycoside hydrolase catalytic domain n=1 Tax=Maribellus maritimus TaxID=2870838 RepID=UPI001EE9BB3B|nr:family 78 glycoside hydrolase catalytic domain [Maribellus maritimus]MCG6189333.1 glycoside hydrolase family 78 protein [Maribellus maritimus]